MAAAARTPKGLRELDRLQVVFAALAHPARRHILTVIRVRGGELTAGAVAARFQCSWPTTTRHLKVLTDAGLLEVSRHGRERRYRLAVEPLQAVVHDWLARFL